MIGIVDMKVIIFLLMFILAGCSSQSPKYYGYDHPLYSFDGHITIKPKLLSKYKYQMNMQFTDYKTKEVSNETLEVRAELIKLKDRYRLVSKSDIFDFFCEYSLDFNNIINGEVIRVHNYFGNDKPRDISSFHVGENDTEDYLPKTKEELCDNSVHMFSTQTYEYGKQSKYLDNVMNKIIEPMIKQFEDEIGSDNVKVSLNHDNKTLGIAKINGLDKLVNGYHFNFKSSMSFEGEVLVFEGSFRGYLLIDIKSGVNDYGIITGDILVNSDKFLEMEVLSEITNVEFLY